MKIDFLQRYSAAGAIFALLLTGQILGQAPGTGAISGVVYDQSDRVIGHAEVVATNEATFVSRTVVTTADGVFHVPLLLPGS